MNVEPDNAAAVDAKAIDCVASIPVKWDTADGTPLHYLLDRWDAEVVVKALRDEGLLA